MHESFLNETITLARTRRGFCAPNPAVGAVIVKNNKIISQGVHLGSGHPHAEVEAINKAQSDFTDAILYTSLEPCCHLNKKTPPCTDLIIQSGIKKVVYAFQDPNPAVAGKGATTLRSANIDCIHLPLAAATDFYRSYARWCSTHLPNVTAKLALSLDGKIAGKNGAPAAITGTEAQLFTHQQRKLHDAILTTAKTILMDDPLLNVRLPNETIAKPLYILDRQLKLPAHAKIFKSANKITIFYDQTLTKEPPNQNGVSYQPISCINEKLSLTEVLTAIGKDGVHDLWIEAGGTLFNAFTKERLLQTAYLYLAPKTLGKDALPGFVEPVDFMENVIHNEWQTLGEDFICKLDYQG